MILKKCTRCQTRPAVIFVTKETAGKATQEGYCIKCAKEIGLKPVDDILKQMGISDEELDAMTGEMDAMLPTVFEGGEEDETGTAPAIDLNNIFGEGNLPANPPSPQEAPKGAKKQPEGKRPKHKCLDAFCIDLTAKARDGKLDRIISKMG